MIDLRFTRKTAGKDERRRHAIAGQSFTPRRHAPIREVDPRTDEISVELVAGAGPNAATHVGEQQPARLIASGCRERHGLGGPLSCCRSVQVRPTRQWPARLETI